MWTPLKSLWNKKMTPAKRDAYLKAAFRKVWRWGVERKAALAAALKGGKYVCKLCPSGNLHRKDDVKVDHINPVVDPKKGFVSWDEYYKRMFVAADGLQVLCDDCHDKKSKAENEERRKTRAKRKAQK